MVRTWKVKILLVKSAEKEEGEEEEEEEVQVAVARRVGDSGAEPEPRHGPACVELAVAGGVQADYLALQNACTERERKRSEREREIEKETER